MKPIYPGNWFEVTQSFARSIVERVGGLSLAVYLILIAHADKNYTCSLSFQEIAALLGTTKGKVECALHRLQKEILIGIDTKNYRKSVYYVLWITCENSTEKSKEKSIRPLSIIEKFLARVYKYFKSFDIEPIKRNNLGRKAHHCMTPKQFQLAEEIAETLNDQEALNLYKIFAEKYPEELLRRTLKKVMLIPAQNIRKTRGALFNFLIQQYENRNRNNFGD